jgi:hypothetical protein
MPILQSGSLRLSNSQATLAGYIPGEDHSVVSKNERRPSQPFSNIALMIPAKGVRRTVRRYYAVVVSVYVVFTLESSLKLRLLVPELAPFWFDSYPLRHRFLGESELNMDRQDQQDRTQGQS